MGIISKFSSVNLCNYLNSIKNGNFCYSDTYNKKIRETINGKSIDSELLDLKIAENEFIDRNDYIVFYHNEKYLG